jgi:hypothetical protein
VRDLSTAEVEFLRYPELPRASVVAVTGDSGSGKSTLVTAWARDVAVPVLFLDKENPAAVIADRLERLGAVDGERLRFWGGWLGEEAPQPDSAVILDWVKACDPKPLVILDSLAAFHGSDQNDAALMRAFMHRCRRLAALGATVVVIHHSGTSETSTDYRGSSDFKAAIDVGLHVSSFSNGGLLDKLFLRPFKNRFGGIEQLIYSYDDGRIVRGDCIEAKESVYDQLTDLLRLNPGITTAKFEDLANQRGLGRNRARTFLGDGLRSRTVRFTSAPKGGKRYFLAGMEDRNET